MRHSRPLLIRWLGIGAVAAGFAVATSSAAFGQALGLGAGDEPLTIDADDGIEWQRDRFAYVARGNATATRGETSVRADQLIAYYTPESDGTDIFRVDAVGGVVILGTQQRIVGDRAVYDVAKGIVVITGDDLRLTTPTEILTARDSLEYWSTDRMAVARGDAVACTGTERLAAEILTAYFKEDEAAGDSGAADTGATDTGATDNGAGNAGAEPQEEGASPVPEGSQSLDRVEAFGTVEILTSTDRAEAEQAVYYAEDEIAHLIGDVRISQGDNQLIGTTAQYDLVTRIFKVENARMFYVQQEEGEQPQGQVPCQVPPFEMTQDQ